MAYSPYPESGLKTWHVVVFLGFVVLVVDIASTRTMSHKTYQEAFPQAFVQAPTPKPPTVELPPGTKLVAIPMDPSQVSESITPGSKPDIMANLQIGGELKVCNLLANVLVVGIDPGTTGSPVEMVRVALTDKQVRALELAKARGCTLTLKLPGANRTPERDVEHDLDANIRFLESLPEPLPLAPPPRAVHENR